MNIFKERFAGKTILITGATSGIGEPLLYVPLPKEQMLS